MRGAKKELLCTRYFCLLDRTKLERGERSLRLRNEVDVPHLPLAKHNRPVRRITSERRWDGEPARQLRIDQHLVPAVKILGKFPLHIAVREHIVLNRLLRLVCLGVGALLRCKDARIVAARRRMIRDMIDDARRLLLEDEPRHRADKLLGIIAVAREHLSLNPLQDLRRRPPRERRPRRDTPDEIIRHR